MTALATAAAWLFVSVAFVAATAAIYGAADEACRWIARLSRSLREFELNPAERDGAGEDL